MITPEIIDKIAKKSGRAASDITIIAVSKKQPDERVESCLVSGQRIFGENRVQEAYSRWQDRLKLYNDISLHLLGPLQSNKAAQAVALFDSIHTIDRPKIAKAVSDEMRRQNRNLTCFIQVNTGLEPQKSGVFPEDLSDFLNFCRDEAGLKITGLMGLPPVDEEAVLHFAFFRTLAQRFNLPHLSMGMSRDYEQAIAFGATHIRIGEAFFGEREAR